MSKSARTHWEHARRRIRSTALVLLGVAGGMPRAAVAQTPLEFDLYVGRYRPTSILASGVGVTLKQQGGITVGMRMTKWWSARLGIEGTVGNAPSALWSSLHGLTYPAQVLTASAKALLRVTPSAARATLHVGGGVGCISHSGDAYPTWYVGPTTFLSGIANLGAAINATLWFVFRLDAEDFVYAAHVGDCTRTRSESVCDIWTVAVLTGVTATPTSSVVQHDFVLSLGFALRP